MQKIKGDEVLKGKGEKFKSSNQPFIGFVQCFNLKKKKEFLDDDLSLQTPFCIVRVLRFFLGLRYFQRFVLKNVSNIW